MAIFETRLGCSLYSPSPVILSILTGQAKTLQAVPHPFMLTAIPRVFEVEVLWADGLAVIQPPA